MVQKKHTKPAPRAQIQSSRLTRLIQSPWFPKVYLALSLVILLGSTIFWSILSAKVHSGNADQLVNPYLFDTGSTMRGALLPGQHSFLLKWPVFFLTKFYGETSSSYIFATVALSLTTVASLAYILHRIDRRPLIKGTLFLCLASVLLVIPAQPYPGGLLPVNMAMVATRNIEYVLYIVCAWGIIRTKRLKSAVWLASCAGLTLLIASDKLFLSLSLGAAVVACIVYVYRQRWLLASFSARWFLTGIVAAAGSLALLGAINAGHIVHISGQGNGPYGLIHSPQQLAHGVLYAALGLFSNFGANAAFDTASAREIPRQALHHMFSLGGPVIAINALILFGGLSAAYNLLHTSLRMPKGKKKEARLTSSQGLSLLLIWTTLAAFGAFVLTDHYYTVDARYLAISLFALFITMATFTRTRQWEAMRLVLIGLIIISAMGLSVPMVLSSYHSERNASRAFDNRNSLIAQAISNHHVNVLVGDYWRVIPIKQLRRSATLVMPLSDCSTARGVLSSSVWQPDLKTNSFAYILSLDKAQTDYPTCSAETIFAAYGKPNVSVVIDGTIEHPKELLLFYDHGSNKSSPLNSAASPLSPTVEAIAIEDLPSTLCSAPTSLNIVAHQDDDLLFMNPDIQRDIAAGHCVRTIYVTAGDAGSNHFFWLGREQGSESAYSKMIGKDAIWIQHVVKLADNQYVTVANPKGNTKISLVFMRLPDGNIHGQGFGASRHESLQKLTQKQIPNIHSIYGDSTYSVEELASALTEFMFIYQPAVIRTQATLVSNEYPDHSDHMSVSRLTERAYGLYEASRYSNSVTIPILRYIGYPIHASPENVSSDDLETKTAAFLSYAKHDGSVCQSVDLCASNAAYGSYLRRQYTQ